MGGFAPGSKGAALRSRSASEPPAGCLGDTTNDMAMMSVADTAVATANATADVKATRDSNNRAHHRVVGSQIYRGRQVMMPNASPTGFCEYLA